MLLSSHDIHGTYYQHDFTVDANLDHLAELVCVRFLHCKVSLLATFHTVLFGRLSL